MKKIPNKSALANIIDRMTQLPTVDGGDISNFNNDTAVIHTNHHSKIPASDKISNTINFEQVVSVDPHVIQNWIHHDRPVSELGDIPALAQDLKTTGQLQPCIVRPCTDNSVYKYEVIAGERRWRAAKEAGIHLKVIVKNLSDVEAFVCQAGENSNRKDLSEFAKGMNYSRLIELTVLTRQELQDKLKLSKSSIRNLLSFSRVSQKIWDAIGDVTNISSTTAYELSRFQDKGEEYVDAIIEIAPKLRTGKIGYKQLEALILARVNNNSVSTRNAIEVLLSDGRHVFTWRNDTNGNRSIAFPKGIRENVDFNNLEKAIVREVEEQISKKIKATQGS